MILEMPEIEVYRSELARRMVGETITAIESADSKVLNEIEAQLERDVVGKTIWFLERRGKHLVFHLDNGKRLLVHLTNKSVLSFDTDEEGTVKPSQLTIHTSKGVLRASGLRPNDVQVLSIKSVEALMRENGIDPFDKRLTLNRFIDLFAKKRGALKGALADHHLLAGIGALYADEIAFAASIRPDIKIPLITAEQWERLYNSMRSVLQEAAASGGLNDNAAALGDYEPGGYNSKLRVYEREGQPCYVCETPIERIEFSSKKAFICPVCQKDEQ